MTLDGVSGALDRVSGLVDSVSITVGKIFEMSSVAIISGDDGGTGGGDGDTDNHFFVDRGIIRFSNDDGDTSMSSDTVLGPLKGGFCAVGCPGGRLLERGVLAGFDAIFTCVRDWALVGGLGGGAVVGNIFDGGSGCDISEVFGGVADSHGCCEVVGSSEFRNICCGPVGAYRGTVAGGGALKGTVKSTGGGSL